MGDTTMPNADTYLHDALAAFDLGAPPAGARRFGSGHINDTYLVETQAGRRFVFQRISPVSFKHQIGRASCRERV